MGCEAWYEVPLECGVDGVPAAVFGDSAGATGVHSNSLLELGDRCYLAIGSYVVCFGKSPFEYHWALQVDEATCFGIYYNGNADALLSHGELEVSRFTQSGQLVWSTSGADIFTEGFTLFPEYVEVIDFNGNVYHFDYSDGHHIVA